jgi:hypothetical protein
MSSKGTIFLTSLNEHVYDETIDDSIGIEIDYRSIDRVEMERWKGSERYVELLNLNEGDGWLYIETRDNYEFVNIFKPLKGSLVGYERCNNTTDCLIFDRWEIKEFCCEDGDIDIPLCMHIYIKKSSEWYNSYVKVMKSYIKSELEWLNNKQKLFNTIDAKPRNHYLDILRST